MGRVCFLGIFSVRSADVCGTSRLDKPKTATRGILGTLRYSVEHASSLISLLLGEQKQTCSIQTVDFAARCLTGRA